MRFSQQLTSTGQFFRLSGYFSSLTPMIGGFALAQPLTPRTTITVVLVAFGFHVFSALTNDLQDRAIDATDPRRAHMPLASGRATAPMAWTVVALCAGGGLLLCAQSRGLAAVALYTAACALVGLYNRFGKQLPVPFVADLVSGAAYGVLVLVGAALAGSPVPGAAPLAVSMGLYVALITGLHGPVRDYDNDRRHHIRTTAAWLCGYAPTLPATLPRRAAAVALLFQAATFVAYLAATAQAVPRFGGPLLVGCAMQAVALALTVRQGFRDTQVERQARLAVPVALLSLLSYAAPMIGSTGPWPFVALALVSSIGWFMSPAGHGRLYRIPQDTTVTVGQQT